MDTLRIDFKSYKTEYSSRWDIPFPALFQQICLPFSSVTQPYVLYQYPSSDLCGDLFSSLSDNTLNSPPNPCPKSYRFDSYDYFSSFNQLDYNSYEQLNRSWFKLPEIKLPEFKLPEFKLPGLFRTSSVKPASSKKDDFNTSVKFTSLKEAGYNASLAQKLAQEAASHVEPRSTGFCSRYVSDAMARVGIAGARGHAWELKTSLRNNSHFKEIDPSSVDVTKLPAGCVLVYPKGDSGYSSDFGHVEITLGDGSAASDFINPNLKQSNNMSIFVPVNA